MYKHVRTQYYVISPLAKYDLLIFSKIIMDLFADRFGLPVYVSADYGLIKFVLFHRVLYFVESFSDGQHVRSLLTK